MVKRVYIGSDNFATNLTRSNDAKNALQLIEVINCNKSIKDISLFPRVNPDLSKLLNGTSTIVCKFHYLLISYFYFFEKFFNF